MTKPRFRPWTPRELRAMFRDDRTPLGGEELATFWRLATDERMREFWAWLDTQNNRTDDDLAAELDPEAVLWTAIRGQQLPVLPGSQSPQARRKHLDRIRAVAVQLARLLDGTRFDIDLQAVAEFHGVERGELPEPSDYPLCALTEQLRALARWTELPDGFDRRNSEVWMIRQGGLPARKVYMVWTFLSEFEHAFGSPPPWTLFAELVNVSLGLDDAAMQPDALQALVGRIRGREHHGDSRDEELTKERPRSMDSLLPYGGSGPGDLMVELYQQAKSDDPD